MYYESGTVDTEVGTVEYSDLGQGDPVLVVHGSPGGCDQGDLLGGFLVRAGMRVIVPSRLGYLNTPLAAHDNSIDHQANLHAELMTSLGIERFRVLCWSGGGPSSYRLAVMHPERVRALVAMAAVSEPFTWKLSPDERFIFGTRMGNAILRWLAKHQPRWLISQTLKAEGEMTGPEVKALTESVMDDPVRREFVLQLAETVSYRDPRRNGLHNDIKQFGAITDFELERIGCPTLLIHGTLDSDVVPKYSHDAARRIPGSTLLMVAGGTHIAAYTDPSYQQIQAQIVEFLQAH